MTPDAALVAAWLAFASLHSGLPIPPGLHPQIELGHPRPGNGAETDSVTGRVTLQSTWSGTAQDQCILAHELTHVLQVAAGWRYVPSVGEPPAYEVQAECLDHFGQTSLAEWHRERAAIIAGTPDPKFSPSSLSKRDHQRAAPDTETRGNPSPLRWGRAPD